MKKIATTHLINPSEEISFNEYEEGIITKVIDETETESSYEELAEMIDTGKYYVEEFTYL